MANFFKSWIPASPSFSATRTVGLASIMATTRKDLAFLGRLQRGKTANGEESVSLHEREQVESGLLLFRGFVNMRFNEVVAAI